MVVEIMTEESKTAYEERYKENSYYWGKKPSGFAIKVLEYLPAADSTTLIDIGCGEGRNAVFFARNGYIVTAYDAALTGVEKTKQLAKEAGVSLDIFQEDMTEFRLKNQYDIIFAHGVLQYLPTTIREEFFENLKINTRKNGINVLSVFVHKPFIPKSPDGEKTSHHYKSGELFTYYHDWQLEYCTEEIFDCNSSGIWHKHAVNKMIARKI